MEVIHLFIAANGVHVGEQALANVELVALERQTLPLSQRVHHLCHAAHIGDVESHRTLETIEVIVKARLIINEQGSGDAAQIQRLTQIHLEIALDKLDGPLHLIDRQGRFVTLGNDNFAHNEHLT